LWPSIGDQHLRARVPRRAQAIYFNPAGSRRVRMVNDAGGFVAGCAPLLPHVRRFSQGFPSTCLNSQGFKK
jgi:hypothetical protein